jgi:hypothetical protein
MREWPRRVRRRLFGSSTMPVAAAYPDHFGQRAAGRGRRTGTPQDMASMAGSEKPS